MLYGKAREMGLGPLNTVSLAQVRVRARAQRQLKLDGIDPIAAREEAKKARRFAEASAITFRACAERYIKAHRSAWKNDKHAAQWRLTLATYAYPVIGELAVGAIDTGHVTRILKPLWSEKPEIASRLRGRIEAVLDYATTHRWRQGENPPGGRAIWRMSCRSGQRSLRSSTTPHYLGARLGAS
jgi:hypothetical protein